MELGRILSHLGIMYAWATPEHVLNNLSLDEVMMYYDYGIEFEKWRAQQVIYFLSLAMDDKQQPHSKGGSDKPDKEAFYATYGDKIKQAGGGDG